MSNRTLAEIRSQMNETAKMAPQSKTNLTVSDVSISAVWNPLSKNNVESSRLAFEDLCGETQALSCPRCGESYVHVTGVEMFDRKEDEKDGTHVRLHLVDDYLVDNHNKDEADSCLRGNPSARRGGVSVHFICEGCEAEFRVDFANHKGLVLVDTKMWV